jgi:hypothetical protein
LDCKRVNNIRCNVVRQKQEPKTKTKKYHNQTQQQINSFWVCLLQTPKAATKASRVSEWVSEWGSSSFSSATLFFYYAAATTTTKG